MSQRVEVGWLYDTETIRGFAARLFGEAVDEDQPDDASVQLGAVVAAAGEAGDKPFPLSMQQASAPALSSLHACTKLLGCTL